MAVREDGIARPRSATWNSCDTATKITDTNCRHGCDQVPVRKTRLLTQTLALALNL